MTWKNKEKKGQWSSWTQLPSSPVHRCCNDLLGDMQPLKTMWQLLTSKALCQPEWLAITYRDPINWALGVTIKIPPLPLNYQLETTIFLLCGAGRSADSAAVYPGDRGHSSVYLSVIIRFPKYELDHFIGVSRPHGLHRGLRTQRLTESRGTEGNALYTT